MIFAKFKEQTQQFWNAYYKDVAIAKARGGLSPSVAGESLPEDTKLLYPNILIFTKFEGFYVAEFMGATEEFDGFFVKEHKENSIFRYFGQFDDDGSHPLFIFNGGMHIFSGQCCIRGGDLTGLDRRYPALELYSATFLANFGHGSLLGFGDDFKSLNIENCIFINGKNNIFRCKSILSAYVVSSSIDSASLDEIFRAEIKCADLNGIPQRVVNGVYTSPPNKKNILIASQFQNMYLFQKMRETRIGEFIKMHPDIIRRAFNSSHFEYEPYLKWIEHDGECLDSAINPDMLIRREDGYYDIYDLKTALLNVKKLTKSGRSRRRFIDGVAEGVAQLANYRDYFRYQKNCEFAKEKYGIEVKDPKLVLIIGSWDNFDIDEVGQAMRQYSNERIEIMDYDTLCHMFINA